MIYPEDIIETVLNHGVESAQRRFGMTRLQVINVVKPFTDEIDEELRPCHSDGITFDCCWGGCVNKKRL